MTVFPIERSVLLPAPVEVVWRYVVDPACLSAWFGGQMHLEARQGGQVGLQTDGAAFVGTVDLVVPRRRVVFTWWPEHEQRRRRTRVTLMLEPRGAQTLLQVSESPVTGSGLSARLPEARGAFGRDASAMLPGEPPSARRLSAGAR